MIVFNTTFHVAKEREKEFLLWLQTNYISQALSGDLLERPRLCRIVSQHCDEGESYSLQFDVRDGEVLSKWQNQVGFFLHQELAVKFAHQVAGFHTLLEIIL